MADINGTSFDDTLNGTSGNDVINGFDGNDVVNGLDGNDLIDGGIGDDRLFGGLGDDTIDGGGGNDYLDSGPGSDVARGGPGDDVYLVGSLDTVVENPGEGTDEVVAGVSYALLPNFENLTLAEAGPINGTGNSADNVITGNGSENVLLGLDGNDTIRGFVGNDRLEGGEGDDTLSGGDGDDTIIGGNGVNVLDGGTGNDVIYATPFGSLGLGDTIYDGSGDDNVNGGFGNDTIYGSAGTDHYDGGVGNDTVNYIDGAVLAGIVVDMRLATGQVRSLAANDAANIGVDTLVNIETVIGSIFADTMTAGTATMIFYGAEGNDVLNGGDGADVLVGGAGGDAINGGNGDDAIFAADFSPYWQPGYTGITPVLDRGAEVDTLNGGAGFDHIYAGYGDSVDGGADGAELLISLAGATSGVTADFSKLDNGGTLTLGGGVVQNINSVRWIEGSDFDDTITASNSASAAFDSTIDGRAGNDHIIGATNSQIVRGGDGNDTLESSYSNGTWYGDAGDDTITLTSSTGSSLVYGGDGNDTLTLAGQADGGDGNDIITAAVNTNYGLTAFGGAGDDTLIGSNLPGQPNVGLFADSLAGGDGADIITGGDGMDRLMSGGDAHAIYQGFAPADYVDSGTEHDAVSGGAGDDTLYVGFGDDADGGTGNNSLSLSLLGSTSGVTLNTATLETGAPVQLGGGTVTNIQHVFELWGSNFNDVLTLSAEATVFGADGSDTINGSSGHDQIYGGAGADIINANGGNDTIWLESTSAAQGDQINGGAGTDTIFVGPNTGYESVGIVSLNGVTITGVECLSQTTNATAVGITPNQIDGFTTILANLYFEQSGAISLNGKSGYGNNTFTLNDGGNQLDLRGFAATNLDSFRVQGGASGDVVTVASSFINFMGDGGDDTLFAGSGNSIFTGGAGSDTLVSGSGGDMLAGGSGNDTLIGTAANLNNDWFQDFSAGDKIVITDADAGTFSFSYNGSTGVLSYTGGSLRIGASQDVKIVAAAAAGGGVQLTLLQRPAENDFNGDGKSDILWRNDNGALTDWLGTQTGGFSPNGSNLLTVVDTAWQVAETGDFNGDGKVDVLWHRADGAITDWLGTGTGGLTPNGPSLLEVVDPSWQIAGVGDFNGDGKDDVVWHRTDGALTDWLGTASGGLSPNGGNFLTVVDTSWSIAGVGDFNGDGKDDVLWHRADGATTTWLGSTSGALIPNGNNFLTVVDPSWSIAGVGDFNGDGKDDVLWHRTDVATTDWLGTANGGLTPNAGNFLTVVSTQWQIAGVGDYNGDHRDDILWRNADGRITDWLGTAAGAFTDNAANALNSVDTHWHVQAHESLF